LQPAGDLRITDEDGSDLLLRRMRLRRADERRGSQRIGDRGRARGPGSRDRRRRQDEPDEYGGGNPQRRKLQSLMPRKLSGTTSRIAIACEMTFPQPNQSMKIRSQTWLTSSAMRATTKKRMP